MRGAVGFGSVFDGSDARDVDGRRLCSPFGIRISIRSRVLGLVDQVIVSNYICMHEDNLSVREVPAGEQVDLAVEVFRMLADATRLQLLWCLLDHEVSVGQLAAATGKPQAGVSQHLAKLRMARLVQTRREGTQVFYRIGNDHVRQLVLDAILHAEHASSGVPEHHRNDPGIAALSDPATAADRTS